jgi:hypothetical protein
MPRTSQNKEAVKITLADCLKSFRDASRKSDVMPQVYRRTSGKGQYGIVRNGSKCFLGIDNTYLYIAHSYGWIGRARPVGGGREGYYWTGPAKVFHGKCLGDLIAIHDKRRHEYDEKRKAEKKEMARRKKALEKEIDEADKGSFEACNKPKTRKFPVVSRLEVVGVWSLPDDQAQLIQAAQLCTMTGFDPPQPMLDAMDKLGITVHTSHAGEISLLELSYAKVLDSSGGVVSIDHHRLIEERPNISQILVRKKIAGQDES